MKEVISYDTEDIGELLGALRIILNRLKVINDLSCDLKPGKRVGLSSRNLVRYEKSSKYYTFYYKDKSIVLDSRTAREHIENLNLKGYVSVNENDMINPGMIDYLDKEGLHLDGTDSVIHVSRRKRALLEKYMDIVYNTEMIKKPKTDTKENH